ncbi:uncharacterized protein LOC131932932 [Physella acuta]|uniref:uncharacterized protein LOC131932932 n=1 Tax=Physella acuta TaxID=109671 RepID=UPI0027DBF11B|nr:uncharacterized protein LOC131932932 [Physella acuta]
MAQMGPWTTFIFFKLAMLLTLWAASFATRGWLYGWETYPISEEIDVGLFKTSYNGYTKDTMDIIPGSKSYLKATIGLMAVGGGCMLICLAFVIVAVLSRKQIFIILAALDALVGGIILLTSVIIFYAKYDSDYLSVHYSWYLGLSASIFSLTTPATIASAMRRGELNFNAVPFQQFKS